MKRLMNGQDDSVAFVQRFGDLTEEMRGHIALALSCIDGADAAGGSLAESSDTFLRCHARMTGAMARMETSGVRLRAAEARLCFEGARLKRSLRELSKAQNELNSSLEYLFRRTEQARRVAENAEYTAALIEEIQAALARGEPVEHLLAAGEDFAAAQTARRRAE